MATVGIKIFKHHKKTDGTYNVKIRVSHKGNKKYIDTPHFVIDKQLTSRFILKDATLKKILNKTLDDYRLAISKLGSTLNHLSAESLKTYIVTCDVPMDFLKFCNDYIAGLYGDDRQGSADTLKTVL